MLQPHRIGAIIFNIGIRVRETTVYDFARSAVSHSMVGVGEYTRNRVSFGRKSEKDVVKKKGEEKLFR